MTLYRSFLIFWIGGLIAFVIVIVLHLPLILTAVPGGMGDHQAAATALEVNRIQAEWAKAGLLDTAVRAMISDLVFIGIYGLGSILAGLHYRAVGTGAVRHLGTIVLVCAVIFTVTDYCETIAQFLQLRAGAGSDDLAGLAAAVRPYKMAAFVVTFVGVLAAMLTRRKRHAAG